MHILLIEDHQLFAMALQLSIGPYFKEFEIAFEEGDLVALVGAKQPDIVLLDIRLGEKNGIEEGKKILKAYPDTKIIFLSGYDLAAYHNAALQMGARAFLNKNLDIQELVDKIKRVDQGETLFPEYQKEADLLTERELLILKMVTAGRKQIDIAATLKISRRTVNNHMQAIFMKFGVNSALGAIVRGAQLGLVKIQPGGYAEENAEEF